MVFTFHQGINPGLDANIDALNTINSQIDAQISIQRLSTSAIPGQISIDFASMPSPEEMGSISQIIASNDPYQTPIDVAMKTYSSMGIIHADVNGTTLSYLANRFNEIHISKDAQNNYSTIRAALDAETGENLVFIVHPGTYAENNPLVVRNGCVLRSDGIFENAIITANNPNSNLIDLGSKALVRGLTIQGTTGACGVYFDASASGGANYTSSVQECAFKNCLTAIEADGKNGSGIPDMLFCEKIKIMPTSQNLSRGLYAHAKGQIVSLVLGMFGVPGYFVINEGVKVDGAGSKISISSNSIWFLNKAMVVDNGGELEINLVTAGYNAIGLEVGSTGTTSIVNAAGLGISNSVAYDLNILPSDAIIQIHSGVLDDTKVNNPNNVTLNAIYHLVRYGKYYQNMTGNVLLGSSREPSKLYAGEGHYDVDRVYILSNSNLEAGSFVDNTTGALSDTAPPFDMFQGTAANNCVYIGRQLNPVGCKVYVNTACTSPVAHTDLAYEYWNGSTWVEFHVATYNSSAPFYTPTNGFPSTVGNYHVMFGLTSASPLAIKTINGKTAKWVRIRIINALSSIPTLEYMKPHPNSTEIGGDGFITHFGDSRVVRKISLEYADSYAASSPADQPMYMSDGLYINSIHNSYATGALNSVSFAITLPRNTDSSFPLKLVLNYAGSSNSAGNVLWRVRYDSTKSGSAVYRNTTDAPTTSANEKTATLVQAITAADTAVTSAIKFNICDILANLEGASQTTLWLVVERVGTDGSDTYGGSINVYDMSLSGVVWCEGTHLLGY